MLAKIIQNQELAVNNFKADKLRSLVDADLNTFLSLQ